MKPLLDKPDKFVAVLDKEWEYVKEDHRIDFSGLSNVMDGSKRRSRRESTLNAAGSTNREEARCTGFFPEDRRGMYKFPTEIFWLSSLAMELVEKMNLRLQSHMSDASLRLRKAQALFQQNPGDFRAEAMLEHTNKCYTALWYGWMASQVEDPDFLYQAILFAQLASKFIRLQMQSSAAADR
jgi:hypothetical protein